MSRRSKKISRLQKDNKFLRYVVERASKEVKDDSCDRCESAKATEHFCESCLTEIINRGN